MQVRMRLLRLMIDWIVIVIAGINHQRPGKKMPIADDGLVIGLITRHQQTN
jgi:hypothetical protein